MRYVMIICVMLFTSQIACVSEEEPTPNPPIIILEPAPVDMADASMDMMRDLSTQDMSVDMFGDMSADMMDMSPDVGPPSLSFASDIFPIFQGNGCSNGPFGGCHGLANPPANLNLTTASIAYTQLVDVTAATGPGKRVVPGDAKASFLVTFANQSLFGVNTITRAQITTIELWIDQGAMP